MFSLDYSCGVVFRPYLALYVVVLYVARNRILSTEDKANITSLLVTFLLSGKLQ